MMGIDHAHGLCSWMGYPQCDIVLQYTTLHYTAPAGAIEDTMRTGEVVQIRVMPADVMTCIDLCTQAGIVVDGMSLAQVVSQALKGACFAAREAGRVPKRDGFEYNEMLAPFRGYPANKGARNTLGFQRRMSVGQQFYKDDQQREALDMDPRAASVMTALRAPEAALSQNEIRLTRRRAELIMKKGADPVNWSEQEQAELDDITRQLAGG